MLYEVITLGTKEPYRMFTSRAEYRLLLREDNADIRLTPIGRELGLVNDERWAFFNDKLEKMEQEQQRLRATWIQPDSDTAIRINPMLKTPISRPASLEDLLRRPEVNYQDLMAVEGAGPALDHQQVTEQIEIQLKYAGYIERQNDEIEKHLRHEETLLPLDLDYNEVPGLSKEVIIKLNDVKPQTVGMASRISGITPAAVSILLVHLKKRGLLRKQAS